MMAAKIVFVAFVFTFGITDGFPRSLLRRYLMYNPADLSTAIGYKNHSVHDMTSLINEASAHAHGGVSSAQYNVPNFPAMGTNGVASQTGNMGTSGSSSGSGASLSSGSSSASFAGTNHWRCDSHAVAQCDTQCLDVDPKDGCPFCITGCTASSSSSQPGTNTGAQSISQSGSGPQSGSSSGTSGTSGTGSGSPFGTPASAPFGSQSSVSQSSGTLSGSGSQLGQGGGSIGQRPGTLTGTSGQGSQSGGSMGQLPSGLSGTGSQGQGSGQGQGQSTNSGSKTPSCPFYPPNCPKVYTKLENGCLICTLLQQLHLQPSTPAPSVVTTTTTKPSTAPPIIATCAPTRCVAPCNVGIVLAPDGCPRCKCPSYA